MVWRGLKAQVAARQVQMPSILADACFNVLLGQTKAVAPGYSRPGMWPEWLLDLKHIMNHPQMSIIISTQDEDFLSYMINFKVSEGG